MKRTQALLAVGFLALTGLALGCNSKSSSAEPTKTVTDTVTVTEASSTEPAQTVTASEGKVEVAKIGPGAPTRRVEFGHIQSLKRSKAGYMLRFDPAEHLTGVTASVAAQEDTGSGDVPNDYYVVDEGHRLLTYRVPADAKLTVVALSNLNGGAPQQIVSQLAAIARGEKVELPSERKEISVAPKILEQFVGTYQLAPKVNMMITIEGGQLISQVSGQGKVPLFATSETKFFPKVVDAEIEFGKDDKGVVTHLVLHQGGRDTKASRTSDKVVEHKEIAVSSTILAQYVGTYELRPGFDLVITLEGNQLVSQATGQTKIPLYAESETKFFPKVMDAEIEFLKDNKGTVTHLMLRQGAMETKALRK